MCVFSFYHINYDLQTCKFADLFVFMITSIEMVINVFALLYKFLQQMPKNYLKYNQTDEQEHDIGNFSVLPLKLLLTIFYQFKSGKDIYSLLMCCKKFHFVLSSEQQFWKAIYVEKYGLPPAGKSNHKQFGKDWKWLVNSQCALDSTSDLLSLPDERISGIGKRKLKVGGTLRGYFTLAGLPHGYCIIENNLNILWAGVEYSQGILKGQGKICYSNGATYEGQFKNGTKEGHGTEFKPGQHFYEGEFKGNLKHGYGEWRDLSSGTTYKGHWCINLRSGFGVRTKLDGSTFEGRYFHGQKDGIGRLARADGLIVDATWHKGQIGDGDFRVTLPNGATMYAQNRCGTTVDMISIRGSKDISVPLKYRNQAMFINVKEWSIIECKDDEIIDFITFYFWPSWYSHPIEFSQFKEYIASGHAGFDPSYTEALLVHMCLEEIGN